jgi:hypothetical protein
VTRSDRGASTNVLDGRQRYVAAATVSSLLLGFAATVVLVTAYGSDPAALAHPGSIVDKGPGAARLVRWGALLDMASYLPLAPLVLYLHARLLDRGPLLVPLLTVSGLAYVLIGGIGGALLASAGPPLIDGYLSASDAGREAARITLETLGHAVLVGLFGTLELIPFGVWMLGVGWLLRLDWPRFAGVSMIAGAGVLASSARTGLTGRTLVEISGPLDLVILAALGFVFVWQLWLVVRLWRGR